MKNSTYLKLGYFGTGANVPFMVLDIHMFLETGHAIGDIFLSTGVVALGATYISAMELYQRKVSNPMEEVGLLGQELSGDAEYECSFCEDPVKKGDRVLKDGEIYCTREHAEEDNQ